MRRPRATVLAALCCACIPLKAWAQHEPAAGAGVAEAEPAACLEPFGPAESEPDALRKIARGCRVESVARLYAQRAYHAELISDLRVMARMQKAYADNDRIQLEQGRLFVALAEAFAERAYAERPGVVEELNLAYEQSIRRVERCLDGYGRLAGVP
jgi:hypothetical protein